MIVSSPERSPERTSTDETPVPEPESIAGITAAELLEVVRSSCMREDPRNSLAYAQMDASHVREAARLTTRLLEAHAEYARVHAITGRGRRKHAAEVHRWLDVVPRPYLVVAQAWALLPAALLDAPEPDPSQRSPLRPAPGDADR